jgi:hypothetical protein
VLKATTYGGVSAYKYFVVGTCGYMAPASIYQTYYGSDNLIVVPETEEIYEGVVFIETKLIFRPEHL